jgi:outer membrane receptor protein involved in Fe transport
MDFFLRETWGHRFVLECLLVAFVATGQSHAQNNPAGVIRGVVTDQTGAAVVSAKVVLLNSSVAPHLTNERGEFTFSPAPGGGVQLEASASGFETRTLEWHPGPGRIEIVLRPAVPGQEITVSANRTSTRLVESPASVVVLSPGDLTATAAFRTDDILRQVPGFSLFRRTTSRTANPTSQGVSLRGLGASGASRALVLVDGFPLNDPFGGWVYWDRVPREEIGSIEVARGGASHLYGSDALGGVISVLRKPVDTDAVSLEAAYGNENTPDVSFAASKRMGQWSGGLSGELFRSDGYIAIPSNQRGPVDTPVNSQDITGGLMLQRKFADAGAVFVRGSVFGEERNNGTPLQTNSTTVRELDFGGDWNSSAGSFGLRAYVDRQHYAQVFSSIAADRSSENPTRDQQVPAQRTGFSAQWRDSIGMRQHLVAGLEEWNTHGTDDELGIFVNGVPTAELMAGGREVNWGGYAEDIIRLTSLWQLTVSGRVDRWQNFEAFTSGLQPIGTIAATRLPDRTESFFSPRAALLRKVTDSISLTASGYRSFRAPTLNELYRSFRVGNVFTESNADLHAERLTGAEGGAILTAWNQRLMLRSTFFWNDITRPVGNVTISSTPTLITRMRENLGRTRSQGVELEATSRVSNALTISGGYEYTDATVLNFSADATLIGRDIPQVPRNVFTFQARYSKPFILLAVQGRYIGNQFDDDQNSLLLRRYFSLDTTVSHAIRPGAELFVAIENLFNQRYDVGRTPVLTVGPPILARAGVRLQFGGR